MRAKTCAVVSTRELTDESLDDCTVPLFYKSHTPTHELPLCPLPLLYSLLEEHKDLFRTVPGHTDIAEHFIPTSSSPVKIPLISRPTISRYMPWLSTSIASSLLRAVALKVARLPTVVASAHCRYVLNGVFRSSNFYYS